MKKVISIISTLLFLIILISCRKKVSEENLTSKDFVQIENFKTPLNRKIQFKKVKNKAFLQWYCEGELQTYKEPFDLNGAQSWIPWFLTENNDYILLKSGCGSPCWIGYFLPLKKSLKLKIINEYLAFDASQNYVAKINYDTDLIEVENITTSKIQPIQTEKCEAVFKAYCIDTIYFKPKEITIKWIDEDTKPHIITTKLQL